MKTIKLSRLILLLPFVLLLSCGGATTKEDVTNNLNEAKDMLSKFSSNIDETMKTKKEYYKDLRDGTLDSLNTRSRNIADQIKDLKKTGSDSQNAEASNNIQSAVEALKSEKKGIDEAIEKVKNREKDWSVSYKSINSSINSIEAELKRLNESLEKN